MSLTGAIAERYEQVRERVENAAWRVGRNPRDIAIVAVTKRHSAAVIEAGFAAGVRRVGENYAQELVAKLDQVGCAGDMEWHFIGRLQRNKVKYLVGRVALIHAVDSLDVAHEIEKRMARRMEQGMTEPAGQRVLISVNVGGEAQKSGVDPAVAGALLASMADLEHVECVGLMTMPPWAERAEDNRPYFCALSELRDTLARPEQPLPVLSMGTTDDFEVAVEEGATLVRVGTAIFGPRPD